MIDRRTFLDRWRQYAVTVRDLPVALLLAAASVVPALQDRGTQLGDLPGRPFDALTAVAILLQCLPLALRRRWPALCLTLVSLGFALDQLRAYHTVAGAGRRGSDLRSRQCGHRGRSGVRRLTPARNPDQREDR